MNINSLLYPAELDREVFVLNGKIHSMHLSNILSITGQSQNVLNFYEKKEDLE